MVVKASTESLHDVYKHIKSPPTSWMLEDSRVVNTVLIGEIMALASFHSLDVKLPEAIPSKKAMSCLIIAVKSLC
jgi:hypothetical protein